MSRAALARAGVHTGSTLVGLLSLGILLAPASSRADGLRDLEDGWLVSPAEARSLLCLTTPSAWRGADDGADAGRATGWWLALGQARLFAMSELPLLAVALGRTERWWSLAAGWQRLGGELWREDRTRLRLVIGRERRCGLVGGVDAVAWAGGLAEQATQLDVVVEYPLAWDIRARGTWGVLGPPSWHDTRAPRRQALFTGGWSWGRWALACERDGKGVPAVQAEVLMSLGARVAWGLRGDPDTGTLGLSTSWLVARALLRSSHLIHPELGITHRWSVAFGPIEAVP